MIDVTRKLTYVSPSDLKPNPANPRKHSRTQIRVLAKSIQAFGFNAPILVDRNMQVVAGHGRLEAAKFLDLARIPVIHLDNLDECQVSPLADHPTPKPVALVADAILDCTIRGDRVLDPFLGSGTTVLAAERKGRKALLAPTPERRPHLSH